MGTNTCYYNAEYAGWGHILVSIPPENKSIVNSGQRCDHKNINEVMQEWPQSQSTAFSGHWKKVWRTNND